jgi:hypothetical protein
MKKMCLGAVVVLTGLLAAPSPLVAHHGAATFDIAAETTLKGTVTEWLWFNPHCFLKFDVKDESGKVTNWAVESGNPTDMTKRGWSRVSFKPGDEVSVTLQPSKSGQPVGRIMAVTVTNGKTFK